MKEASVVAMHRPKKASVEAGAALREVKQQVVDAAVGVGEGVRAAKGRLVSQAGEAARGAMASVSERAEQFYEQQRDRAAQRVAGLGRIAHQAAHGLHAVRMDAAAEYVDAAGGQVEHAAGYIQEREFGQVVKDVGGFIDRNRAPAAAGLFVAAFLAARVWKATAARADGARVSDLDGDDDQGGGRVTARSETSRRRRRSRPDSRTA